MSPFMLKQIRWTWNSTFEPFLWKIPQQKWRSEWQARPYTIRGTLPLSGTMWSQLTRGCFTNFFLTCLDVQGSWMVMMNPTLMEVWRLHFPYHVVKCLIMNQVVPPNYESSCTSAMVYYFVRKRSYAPNNPHQRYHKYHLVTMMAHAYAPLSLVEGYRLRRMVNNVDPYIWPITRYKLTRTLIPQKLQKEKTEVSTLIYGVRCVVISYELWMSKAAQYFSLMTHFTPSHFREHAHIFLNHKKSCYTIKNNPWYYSV